MVDGTEAEEQNNEPPSDVGSIWIPECRSTALYLDDLQRKIMAEYQTKDSRRSPLLNRHIDENYMMVHSSVSENPLPFARNREEVFDNVGMALKNDKAFAWTIDNLSVNVHRGTRTAEVYFVIQERYTYNGQVLWREGCGDNFFERRLEDGIWVAYRYHSLRYGGPHIAW